LAAQTRAAIVFRRESRISSHDSSCTKALGGRVIVISPSEIILSLIFLVLWFYLRKITLLLREGFDQLLEAKTSGKDPFTSAVDDTRS
jgi:hypothetical protein